MNDSAASSSRRADVGAVVFALLVPTLVTLVYFVWLADSAPLVQRVAYAIGKTVQFGFPLYWVLVAQRRALELRVSGTAGLMTGIALGAVILAGMLLLYHGWLKPGGHLDAAAEEVRRKVSGLGLDSPTKYFALGVFYAVGHSFLEEYYWRWFVFGQLQRLVALRWAIVVSSLGFMAHHVVLLATYFGWLSLETAVFSLCVAVGGAAWAWIYHRSGSLGGPWASHLLVDAGIFLVGYDLIRNLPGG
jgi:membrane protease YdiL (CAAX protease family)